MEHRWKENQAAENLLREVQTAKAEVRTIRKNKNTIIALGSLRDWYLDLSEVKQKRSFSDIAHCVGLVVKQFGENTTPSQLKLKHIEDFRKLRLRLNSKRGRPTKPATINRNVANFRAMIHRAADYGKLEFNPLGRIKQLEENNIRERVLTQDEFNRLLSNCHGDIKVVCYNSLLSSHETG